MNKFNLLKQIYIVLSILIFSSCFTVKPSTVKSGKKLFETFYVGEEGIQYFIKPLTYKNDIGEELKLDITFRYKDEIKDSAIMNISLLGNENNKNLRRIEISDTQNHIIIKDIKHLFTESNKKIVKCRFSMKCPLYKLTNMFINNDWGITVYRQENHSKYTATKKTKKTINKLRDVIFTHL